ncbi:hypothetical protein H8709_01135 [Oscillospiraceae bacterium NSJ-54]|uniref:Carbohydrate binding domain-containing protein n=1 Tax=Zongyangia hominis TaxID=2763677 RepID=A0A926EBQ8_9FIRM|nr:hypothetical protein [Zongyangia hominis]
MRENRAAMKAAFVRIQSSDSEIEGAERWLYDNFYIIERESKNCLRALAGLRRLPLGEDGLPVIFTLLSSQVTAPQKTLEEGMLLSLLEQAQKDAPFCWEELCAVKSLLQASALLLCADGVAREREEDLSYGVRLLISLEGVNFRHLSAAVSRVAALYERDPAGVYPKMDEESREEYCRLTALLARRRGMDEVTLAEEILLEAQRAVKENGRREPGRKEGGEDAGRGEKSKETSAFDEEETFFRAMGEKRAHVGWYLLHDNVLTRKWKLRGILLLAGAAGISLGLSLGLSFWMGSGWLWLLLLLPVWEVVKTCLEPLLMRGVEAAFLPRMELPGGVPKAARTLVVISTLLPSAGDIGQWEERLKKMAHAAGQGDIGFLLLCDYKVAPYPEDPVDASRKRAAEQMMGRLNAEQGERFFLFLRPRRFSKTQNMYSGWERKRGAITELVRLIKTGEDGGGFLVGDKAWLRGTKYLLALDADTGLTFDCVPMLVAAAEHPFCRPVVDPRHRVVAEGFGILAPRIVNALPDGKRTPFSAVMAGSAGITPYEKRAGEVYQDLFGSSLFCGKGLIEVNAFSVVLEDRWEENRILSHDILEGGYLRTALVSDVELTDGFPASMGGWMLRLHRWIRGDWQNLPFLGRVLHKGEETEKNPLSMLSRCQLFDNLRRSLTPVLSYACVLASPFFARPAAALLAAAGVLGVIFPFLLGAVRAVVSGGAFMLCRRYYGDALPDAGERLMQALFALVMLPKQALVSLDACLRALYRRFLSHKNLLEWQTAAQSEQGRGGFWRTLAGFWLVILLSVPLLFAPYGFVRILGLIFLSSPLVAFFTARKSRGKKPAFSGAQREKLLGYCARMWRFYEELCGEEDHFLPPDNIQMAPMQMVAHRTSPTNIGLMMLSTLAARDLGLIDTGTMAGKLCRAMGSVEQMKKYRGNLYNWYDTRTLEPLSPRFVSSVDSGNLLCFLISLKEGLREYAGEDGRIESLISRMEKCVRGADLAVFYDKNRDLFRVGYDAEGEKLGESCYDFLMSEARMLSYYAVAARQVPKRHWGRLSRAMSRLGSYAGPVSWTGTMFEYFMPHLVLPAYEGSLLSEGLRYAIHCQRRRVRGLATPWGISESGYYRFDNQMVYQYKAHGVQKLGVKRDLDKELVVSPYSTFLALPFCPQTAMKNLDRLSSLGLMGKYGFYEAVDFTKARIGNQSMAVVRSFMAHHVGMSIVASVNALMDNRFVRRFLRDGEMSGCDAILREKVHRDTVMLGLMNGRDGPRKREEPKPYREEYVLMQPQNPRAQLLSNTELSGVYTDLGAGHLDYHGMNATRKSRDLLRGPEGCYALLSSGGKTMSLTPAPYYDPSVDYHTAFSDTSVAYHGAAQGLETSMECAVHGSLSAELRQIIVRNTGSQKRNVSLLLYFEPVMAPERDYTAHPAFSKLFVEGELCGDKDILLFHRRGAQKEMALAAGFLDKEQEFSYELKKDALFDSRLGMESLKNFPKKEFHGGTGVPDCVCAVRLSFPLPPKGKKELTFLTCVGEDREAALSAMARLRRMPREEVEKVAKNPESMESAVGRCRSEVLSHLNYPQYDCRENMEALRENTLGQQGLWRLGISGDLPVVLLPMYSAGDGERLRVYLEAQQSLRLGGQLFDLAVCYDSRENGQEHCEKLARRMLTQCGSEPYLGAPGGVFLVDRADISPETVTLLEAAACHIAPKSMARMSRPLRGFRPMAVERSAPRNTAPAAGLRVEGGTFVEEKFYVDKRSPLPYSHALCNPTFGTLLSDSALGFSWAVNSRECRLTPWQNDSARDNRGEALLLRCSGREYDLLNGAQAVFEAGRASYYGVCGDVNTEITVSVPARGSVKHIDVTLENRSNRDLHIEAAYYTEPVLGVLRDQSKYIQGEVKGRTLLLHNPYNTAVPSYAALASSEPAEFLFDRAAFWSGEWGSESALPNPDPCAAVIVKKKLPPRRARHIRFILSFAQRGSAAEKLLELPNLPAYTPPNRVALMGPDQALDTLFTHWLPWQVYSVRVAGRCAFYQNSGAYGFRDQLQDVGGLCLLDPQTARRHIIRASAVQFREGDVLHWWHNLPQNAGGLRGVRTRYSDDLVWLPYVASEYWETTGDDSLWSVPTAFLEGDVLADGEQERYMQVARGKERVSVYEHCARAIDRAYQPGKLGLPKIGGGDWNDGYNKVGASGAGQSVWLALFLSMTMERFLPVCRKMGDGERAERYEGWIDALKRAVDGHCYQDGYYLRAFYDDGTPMGAKENDECRIDSLPQSFSVLAGLPDKGRQRSAMDAAWGELVDEDYGIIRLFTPPFHESSQEPGYVKNYPRGIRENGGQYTHGAMWFAMAALRMGDAGRGESLVRMLNPIHRCEGPKLASAYKLEPYAIAADIYTNDNCYGRGGWSMYTGAASWYYRVILRELLGLHFKGGSLIISPVLPESWPGFTAQVRLSGKDFVIQVRRGERDENRGIPIPLASIGERLSVTLGERPGADVRGQVGEMGVPLS